MYDRCMIEFRSPFDQQNPRCRNSHKAFAPKWHQREENPGTVYRSSRTDMFSQTVSHSREGLSLADVLLVLLAVEHATGFKLLKFPQGYQDIIVSTRISFHVVQVSACLSQQSSTKSRTTGRSLANKCYVGFSSCCCARALFHVVGVPGTKRLVRTVSSCVRCSVVVFADCKHVF